MKYLVLILALLPSSMAFALKETRNGGHAIVCRNPDGTIATARLLDYYEADNLAEDNPAWKIDLGAEPLSRDAKIQVALDRLAAWSPERAERYRFQAASFDEDTKYTDQPLPLVEDSDYDEGAKGCALEQAAIQNSLDLPSIKRFKVNKSIYEKLSPRDQAGLVLHEIIYREALSYDHQRSTQTRYFNGLLASDQLKSFGSLGSKLALMRELNFAVMEHQGVEVKISECHLYQAGDLREQMPPRGYCQTAAGWVKALPSEMTIEGDRLVDASVVVLRSTQRLGERILRWQNLPQDHWPLLCAHFYPSGRLQRLTLSSDDPQLSFQTALTPTSYVSFTLNSEADRLAKFSDTPLSPLTCGRVEGEYDLPLAEGGTLHAQSGSHFRFDDAGRIVEILKSRNSSGWWCSK